MSFTFASIGFKINAYQNDLDYKDDYNNDNDKMAFILRRHAAQRRITYCLDKLRK